jgi:alpha-ketoglutarate-dependent taurine dioxygenase
MAHINAAIHGAATVFRWQRGDVIIIDNIRAAHGRLNVSGPRRILTALGDMYDVKSARAPAARAETYAPRVPVA